MTCEINRSGSNPIIMEYTAKDAPSASTLDVHKNNIRSQGNRQSTNINDDVMVEAGEEMEILFTQVTLLLKVPASNNACNATWKLLQDFLVKIQQSDRYVAIHQWYSSNNNSSTVPIKRTDDVSKYFKTFQTYCPRLNPKQHTKKQPVYASIFFRRSDYLAQLQKYMSFWLKNGGHRLY